jgi:hypothetical protein
MARRSLLPETAGLRVGPIPWAGRGLDIEADPREPQQCPGLMAYASSPEGGRRI